MSKLRKKFAPKNGELWKAVAEKMTQGKKGTRLLRKVFGDKFVNGWEKQWAEDKDGED